MLVRQIKHEIPYRTMRVRIHSLSVLVLRNPHFSHFSPIKSKILYLKKIVIGQGFITKTPLKSDRRGSDLNGVFTERNIAAPIAALKGGIQKPLEPNDSRGFILQ